MANLSQLAPSLAASTPSWHKFGAALDGIVAQLLPLSPALKWPVVGASGRHIGDVSAADFAFKLANIHWTLVDASFTGLNGGVGFVQSFFRGNDWQDPRDWLRAEEQINRKDFESYLALTGGMDYLILHETAHVTTLGIQTNNQQFDHYCHRGGNPSDGRAWAASPEWLYNEQVANATANAVAQALGLLILDHPTCGFPDDPTATAPIRTAVKIG